MPVHDWTRVTAGTFHDFHLSWIAELRRALNGGLLPSGYYAMAEQVAGPIAPDVLTLQGTGGTGETPIPQGAWPNDENGGIAVAVRPPLASKTDTITEAMVLALKRRRLVIRHTTGDRIVAMLEIVSPGNKQSKSALRAFVEKTAAALDEGYHLLVIDLFPPGTFDRQGIHHAIWSQLGGEFELPEAKPLTLASYVAAAGEELGAVTSYVEPIAIGDVLIDMPLFLSPSHYVNVPLERTYGGAYEGVAERWKRVIEAKS